MRERNIYQLSLTRPQLGTEPETQAHDLTGSWTSDLLLCENDAQLTEPYWSSPFVPLICMRLPCDCLPISLIYWTWSSLQTGTIFLHVCVPGCGCSRISVWDGIRNSNLVEGKSRVLVLKCHLYSSSLTHYIRVPESTINHTYQRMEMADPAYARD